MGPRDRVFTRYLTSSWLSLSC